MAQPTNEDYTVSDGERLTFDATKVSRPGIIKRHEICLHFSIGRPLSQFRVNRHYETLLALLQVKSCDVIWMMSRLRGIWWRSWKHKICSSQARLSNSCFLLTYFHDASNNINFANVIEKVFLLLAPPQRCCYLCHIKPLNPEISSRD